ncbi:MAG: peptidoglycan DD-metalloendopeptidase family protein [Woeseiaceae bacterium]|nr:peptidoglycan DD-metalloendopeptidase family protein [Woeseiaceae bacterium]
MSDRSGSSVIRPVIETDGRAIVLDLGVASPLLADAPEPMTVQALGATIDAAMAAARTEFAYGRWGERRDLYRSAHFASDDPDRRRDIHLGVDIFCPAGTPVRSPQPGRIHAWANNARDLDYGPVIILEHDANGGPVYTLYGHLSLDSLDGLEAGRALAGGEPFARVGRPPENGNWPPHLHFQLILDLQGLGTEFPGVAACADAEKWLALSPLPAAYFADVDAAALHGRR